MAPSYNQIKAMANHSANIGIAVIRIGIGLMYGLHGLFKVLGGTQELEALGSSFAQLSGTPLNHQLMGWMAAGSQILSGLLLATGFKKVWGLLIGLPPLLIAAVILVREGEPFSHFSHPIELSILFTGLLIYYRGVPGKQRISFKS